MNGKTSTIAPTYGKHAYYFKLLNARAWVTLVFLGLFGMNERGTINVQSREWSS